jgi:hypothetical protein
MPAISGWLRFAAAFGAIAASIYGVIPARATDVTAEWSTIQMPPPPSLKVPTLKALHDRARAASMLVAYTLPGGGKIIDDGIAARGRSCRSETGGTR